MALPLYHHVSSISTSVFLYGASPLSSCHFNINLSLPLWRFPSIIMSLQYQPQSFSMALPLYHHVSSISTSVFLYGASPLSSCHFNINFSLPLWRFPSIIMSLQYQPQSSSMALPLYHHVTSISTSVFLYGASPLSSCHFNINFSLPLWRFPSIIMSLQYQPQSSSMALPLYHHVTSISTSVFLYGASPLSSCHFNINLGLPLWRFPSIIMSLQ